MKYKIIPKAELVHGATYLGHCRNARVAMWDKVKNKFVYLREKLGAVFPEMIEYPTDQEGHYDVFEPYMRLDFDKMIYLLEKFGTEEVE